MSAMMTAMISERLDVASVVVTLLPDGPVAVSAEPVNQDDGWNTLGWAEAARKYHADRKRWQVMIDPVAKARAQVEALLLRVDIHGVEIVFEPGNLRLLRHLHHHDRDRFLQVRAGLEDVGVSRDGQERIPFAERMTCSVDALDRDGDRTNRDGGQMDWLRAENDSLSSFGPYGRGCDGLGHGASPELGPVAWV